MIVAYIRPSLYVNIIERLCSAVWITMLFNFHFYGHLILSNCFPNTCGIISGDVIRHCWQSADVWSTASLNNITLKNSINEDFPIACLDVRVLAVLQEIVLMCMCVLSGVNVMLRKIAVAAASKPSVEITQDGETLSIKTSTSVRTTHVTFTVGQEFNEATVDGRPCTVYIHTHIKTRILKRHPTFVYLCFPIPKCLKKQEPYERSVFVI